MNGHDIVKAVLCELAVTREDFFGRRRAASLTAARIVAAERLSAAGYEPGQIAHLIKRDRTSVLYYLRPAMRERRVVYYAERYAKGAPEREAARALREAKPKPPSKAKRRIGPRIYPLWTAADTDTAVQMLADRATDAEFREKLNRTRVAAWNRVDYVGRIVRKTRPSQRALRVLAAAPVVAAPPRIDPNLLADARRRSFAPRSLTAWALGDPAPGFSEWDRRKFQTAEAGA
jgi:hypothetical protein